MILLIYCYAESKQIKLILLLNHFSWKLQLFKRMNSEDLLEIAVYNFKPSLPFKYKARSKFNLGKVKTN